MKQSLHLTVFLSIFITSVFAQVTPPGGHVPPPSTSGTVHFSYDTAGNQIKRSFSVAKSAVEKEVVAENEIEDDETLEKTSLLEYFPNPVENELTLTWAKSINTNVKSIQIYSLDSKMIKNFSTTKNSQEHRMSLGHLAVGIYIVKVSFDNGKQESFKIIKN